MMISAVEPNLKSSIQKALASIPGLENVNNLLLEKCTAVCSKYGLSPEDLSGEVDAFLMNHTNITSFGIDNMGRLEDQILKTKNRIASNASKAAEQSNKKKNTVLMDTAKSIVPINVSSVHTRATITVSPSDMDCVTSRYRYMSTTLYDRARALDSRIVKLQGAMCEANNITEVHPLGLPSQETVWVCGRVCCETSEGKLNSASVVLEGSCDESNGRRIHLDLRDIPTFSLFPGQIIMVEGVNSSGSTMIAKRIIEGAPKTRPSSSPAKLLEFHHSDVYQKGKPLRVFSAAGPFTCSQNLDYEPFNDLMNKVYNERPDVLILLGPFVDITHPLLKDGDVTLNDLDDNGNIIGQHAASFENVFIERIIRDGLTRLFQSEDDDYAINTHIILIPSLADAHHEFVFPQPPFADRELEKIENHFFDEAIGELNVPFSKDGDPLKRVHLMSNPCMFRVNEVLFGTTSFDAILALSAEEISLNSMNRIEKLASHLIQQQSFAPMFPAPANCLSQFDQSKHKQWLMKSSPDVLILPSKLTMSPKDINGTFVINPGSLAKGSSKGTFADITISPMKESDLKSYMDDGASILHNVAERTRVEIAKI